MKKLISSLVLVLVLCLVFSIGLAATQDAVPTGASYSTLTYTHNGVVENEVEAFTAASCTAAGSAWIKCTFETNANNPHHIVIAPLGHVWDQPGFEAELASQVKAGEYGKYIWYGTYNDSNGAWHNYSVVKDAKSCVYHVTCIACEMWNPLTQDWDLKDCGATKDITVHYWSSEKEPQFWGRVTDAMTCVTGGQAEDYCVICGASRPWYRDIAPMGHSFDEYRVDSLPQCAKGDKANEYKVVDGVARLYCRRCGTAASAGDKTPNGVTIKASDLTVAVKYDKGTNTVAVDPLPLAEAKVRATDRNTIADMNAKNKWPNALHDYDGLVTMQAPTCTTPGKAIHWCLRCGVNTFETIAPIKHKVSMFVKMERLENCFIAHEWYECPMCHGMFDDLCAAGLVYEDNGVTLHKWDPETDPMAKKENPVSAHTYDPKVKSTELAKNAVDINGKPIYDADHPYKTATCEKPGYIAYECLYTHKQIEGHPELNALVHPPLYVEVDPAKGHDWSEYTVVFNPGDGDNKTGFYSRYCKKCGAWDNTHSAASPVFTKENAAYAFVKQAADAMVGQMSDAEIAALAAQLKAGTITAADVVKTLAANKAFADKKTEDKVNALYQATLGRPATGDPNAANWVKALNEGSSENAVINGFTDSNEFALLCAKYGLTAGKLPTEYRDQDELVTAFVNRCYKVALGRNSDAAGLNNWTSQLLTGANTAKGVAYGFVFSPEFDAQGKIAAGKAGEVVDALYALYLDRPADAEGRNNWVTLVEGGLNLEDLNNGFADSPEFKGIVHSYGLTTNN